MQHVTSHGTIPTASAVGSHHGKVRGNQTFFKPFLHSGPTCREVQRQRSTRLAKSGKWTPNQTSVFRAMRLGAHAKELFLFLICACTPQKIFKFGEARGRVVGSGPSLPSWGRVGPRGYRAGGGVFLQFDEKCRSFFLTKIGTPKLGPPGRAPDPPLPSGS